MGLKRPALGNRFREHIRNLMGTHWELENNMENNIENKRKMKINPFSHPQIQKKIKSRHFYYMIHLTHCLHVFLVSKPLGRCFSPGLITRAEIERGRKTKNNPPPTPAHPTSACSAFPLAA